MNVCRLLPLYTLGVSLAFAVSARAGALVADPADVVLTNSSNITAGSESLVVQNVPPAAVKISGDANFTKNNTSDGTITARIQGRVTANTSEDFFIGYDFGITLTGTGQISFRLEGQVQAFPGGPFITIVDQPLGTPFTGPGTQPYFGSSRTDIPQSVNNLNFRANLVVSWTGGSAGNTLAVNIPNNSIDLAIIPEPTSMALLGFAGIGLVSRRRR